MRRRWTFLLLVAASVLHLPVVYHVVRRDEMGAPLALSLGLLSMGLAWSGGCALENRRRGTVRGLAAAGVALGLLALVPFPESFSTTERALMLGGALVSALALALLMRTPPRPHA